MQIANTKNIHEKNEIFVETLASTGVSFLGGYVVGLFLVSNPIGWGTAIVLATGSAAVSYGMGKFARNVYNTFEAPIDFVTGSGVSNICK